jgi:hypothetical protein
MLVVAMGYFERMHEVSILWLIRHIIILLLDDGRPRRLQPLLKPLLIQTEILLPQNQKVPGPRTGTVLPLPFSCDELYSIPTTISKRATMLGYGHKDMGLDNATATPGVGTYTFNSGINPEKNMRRSISFGVSREVYLS